MFAAWGRFVFGRKWWVLAVSVLFLGLSIASFQFAGKLSNKFTVRPEAVVASDLITKEIPKTTGGGSGFTLLYVSDTLKTTDPAFEQGMEESLAHLRGDPRVTSITTPYEPTAKNADAMVSKDGHQAIAYIRVRDDFLVARDYYPELRAQVHSSLLKVYGASGLAIGHDFDSILNADLQRAEFVSLPMSLLLLLLVFGTIVAALLPVGVGGLAVVSGVAMTFLLARYTNVSTYAINIVTLIGLGVAIDYSLLIVNRFREELANGATPEVATERTMATAGRAITFSGLTVAIGLGGMLFFRGTFLASMGLAGTFVVATAVLYGLSFLPALLAILGPRVNRFRVLRLTPRRGPGFWHALASWVMKRPLVVLIPSVGFILLAGVPFLSLRMANGDTQALPPRAESRQGNDRLIANFPGQNQNDYAVVVNFADGPPLTSERVGQLYDYVQKLAGLPNVLKVQSPLNADPKLTRADYQALLSGPRTNLPAEARDALSQSVGAHIVVIDVQSNRTAASDGARALLRDLRALPGPTGAQVLVTGSTAFDVDLIKVIVDDFPAAIIFIIVVTYLVLFLLVGSLVLPLKAVITNLLSISASFGAMVWIFQEGHLSGLLQFTPASIDPTLPVLLFCIVFGLSMDYEVMLLTRIQEEYRRSGDNTQAVAEGLERSGRLITGAALIMFVVFMSFGLAEVVLIKAIGIGLAIAVLIDATVVRMLIVPAIMRLLGPLNWWAPHPLARLHERLNLGESSLDSRPVGDTATAMGEI